MKKTIIRFLDTDIYCEMESMFESPNNPEYYYLRFENFTIRVVDNELHAIFDSEIGTFSDEAYEVRTLPLGVKVFNPPLPGSNYAHIDTKDLNYIINTLGFTYV